MQGSSPRQAVVAFRSASKIGPCILSKSPNLAADARVQGAPRWWPLEAGAWESLEALATAAGYAAEDVQAALLASVPLLISIPWKPHQSQAHTNALMADITRAMSGRQKSPSNLPSNPSSFKKLSTTEDL